MRAVEPLPVALPEKRNNSKIHKGGAGAPVALSDVQRVGTAAVGPITGVAVRERERGNWQKSILLYSHWQVVKVWRSEQ